MPACARETVQWPLVLERARAGSSSSSSCSSSGSELGPVSPTADWAPSPESIVTRFLGWYPALVIRLTRQMLAVTLYLVWNQIFLSTGLWLVDCLLHVPLTIAKFVLSVVHGGRGRTVVITGSSVETLQIARNFYRSGARVVVVEHDDNYGVVRFSTVVHKFYKVPSPQKYPQEYVRELCTIAERENAAYFVPTSTSHSAHYDALAKPYLEKIGVKCMCPGLKEVFLIDDPAAMLQLCQDAGLAIPIHNRVTTREQLSSLYEEGQLRRARHVLFNAGAIAVRDTQVELELPQTRRGYRRLLQTQPKTLLNISVTRPALVVQIPEGERLVTCTTVREGRVVANVTCRAPLPEEQMPALVPLHRDDVEQWLENFIAAVPGNKSFTGHVSFTLIVTRNGIVPICSRLGVTLPYLCYTSQQPRVLMRPCKHHQVSPLPDKNSLILTNGCYWLHESVLQTVRTPSVQQTCKLLHSLLRKNEVLFQTWDPMPSVIFYGLQVPVRAAFQLLLRPHRTNVSCKHSVHFSTPECTAEDSDAENVFKFISAEPHKNGYKNGRTSNGYASLNGHYSNGHCSNGHSNGHVVSIPHQNGHVLNIYESNNDLIQL